MKKYESLNGLRVFAAIGIVIMHVRANIDITVTGNYVYSHVIPVMSDFIFLFMMVSAFSLSCGYYDRFKNGTIKLNDFYKRRYSRILPFFAILVFLSVVIPHSPNKVAMARAAEHFMGSSGLSPMTESIVEGLTELTLGYGLLPNSSLSIMGVGWFLGVIFLFYMLYPFFVFLIDNKCRAWISFVIVNILCFFCIIYYFGPKFVEFKAIPKSFLYNVPFFLAGGLIFLYKDTIEKLGVTKIVVLLLCIGLTFFYWFSNELGLYDGFTGVLIKTALMGSWLIFTISWPNRLMHNNVIDYLSGISMEIYLSHMMSFRTVQFLHISNYIQNMHLCYWLTCFLTLAVAIVFSHVVKYIVLPKMEWVWNRVAERKN